MITSKGKGPIPQFLDKVSQNWGLSFLYTKIWAVSFSAINSNETLLANISKILTNYGDINKFTGFVNKNNIYADLLKATNNLSVDVNTSKHFLLANKISIPGETVSVSSSSLPIQENAGGIIMGRFGGGRSSPGDRSVDITFINTNKEFVDLVIRPWIVATAHRGLIETNDTDFPSIKCDINAYFFAKGSPENITIPNSKSLITKYNFPKYVKKQNGEVSLDWELKEEQRYASNLVTTTKSDATKPFLRKQIIFKDCVPISIPDKNYNYASDIGNDEMLTDVKFSYDYYEVVDFTSTVTEIQKNASK